MLLSVIALFAAIAFSFPAAAQDLKDVQNRQKIAAQKIVAQVEDAIDRSRKQDPKDAKFALQEMIRQVRESTSLTSEERAPLVQRLQARLAIVQDAGRSKAIEQDQKPLRDPPKYKTPANDPNGGVGAFAKNYTDQAKNASKTHAELIREREKNRTLVDLGIEKSAVLTDKEIAFAPEWKKISERRKEFMSPKLTEAEVKLLKTLNSTISLDYNGDEFKAVINHLSEKSGLTILIDEPSLEEARVDYKDPVNFKVPKVTVRTALKKILGDKGLTYIIKEGNIQVMTPKKATEYTVIRTYSIDDLVTPITTNPQMLMMFGPQAQLFQMNQNAQMIINMIQMTVEPSYWQPNGPGSITFLPATRSLVVRASAELHYQLGSPGMFGGR